MWYAVLADLVVLIHFLFVSFVVFGGLLAMRFQWVVWIHLPAVCWGILIELLGFGCPLTPWRTGCAKRPDKWGTKAVSWNTISFRSYIPTD